MDLPPFDDVGIVGLGLIGGSVALAAKRRWPKVRIKASDPSPVAREAVTQGLIESLVATPADLAHSGLIVIDAPVQTIPGVLDDLAQAKTTALVTDTGSTKRAVMAAAMASASVLFAGGHPMAASEVGGLHGARADLFDGRPWLLVSSGDRARAEPEEARAIKEAMLTTFIVGLGAKPEWTDAVTHDRVIAHVNQAPHAVSLAVKSASGVVESQDDAWQGVLDTNADFIAEALVAMVAKLPTSSSTLMETTIVRDILERARTFKPALK
jgi:prephenate dehydrogenase